MVYVYLKRIIFVLKLLTLNLVCMQNSSNAIIGSLFFPQKRTPFSSYKNLQLWMLYTSHRRDLITPSYVEAQWLKKGRGHRRDSIIPSYVEVQWLKKGRGRLFLDEGYCFLAPSDSLVMSLHWLFKVDTTSLYISCNNAAWCMLDWRRPTYSAISR